MALLDGLLGGGDTSTDTTNVDSQSNSNSFDFATNPQLGVNASDILQSFDSSSEGSGANGGDSDTSAFSGVGNVDLGFASPTDLGFDNASDSFSGSSNQSDSDGGLLQGLM